MKIRFLQDIKPECFILGGLGNNCEGLDITCDSTRHNLWLNLSWLDLGLGLEGLGQLPSLLCQIPNSFRTAKLLCSLAVVELIPCISRTNYSSWSWGTYCQYVYGPSRLHQKQGSCLLLEVGKNCTFQQWWRLMQGPLEVWKMSYYQRIEV